jgi:hypothetical protein
MSGYVPNNRHIRKAPEPKPYNGNFDQQARHPMQTPPAGAPQRMVGMRFIWDNGELLPPNIPYLLTADQGSPIRGGLDARGSFIQQLQANHYEAQLLAEVDVDTAVASARKEMQAALDEILTAERAEAEKRRKEQEGRNVVVNYFHVRFAFGKGFFLGAWGLVKSLKEMSDLVNPFNSAWNMLASAWKAKATPQEGWYANFLNNYSAAQHEELVEALGFDPASITREKIAEAYETACFIYDDGPSKDILASFAVDYAKAQNVEEVAEFGGGAVFELVLAALLVIFTGGAGLAARGATSIRHAASLKRLGSALQRLSRTLKNAKIKLKGRGKGTGTGAQTVEVPRPKEIKAERMEHKQTGAGSFTGSADEAYEAIRASKTDIEAISRNTGIKPENVKKVKDHLFYEEHLLDRYVDYGIPAETGRFDSDLGIANAWKRLENGTFTADDIKLLKHETAESWYMRRHGPGYTGAHNAADKRFPAPDLGDE